MVEFRDTNYWNGKKTPQQNMQAIAALLAAQQANAPTFASVTGGPPIDPTTPMPDAQVAAQALGADAPAQTLTQANLDAIRNRYRDSINTAPDNPITRLLTTNPDTKFENSGAGQVRHHYEAPYKGPSLGSTMGKAVSSGVGDMVSSIFGDGGPIGSIVDAANNAEAEAANSPEAILRRLQQESGQFTYGGPSAEEMAKNQFDPQFELLKSIADQTTNRYNSNKTDISNMYAGLVNDQTAARGEDKAMFDAAVGKTGASYDAAAKGLTDNTAAYSKAMAAEMARLGIKEGAGDVVGGVQNNLTDNLGRLSSQGQSAKDLLSGLSANEYTYDTNQIGTAKQAGINTQNDFLKNYMDAMAGNDQQRLQLTGQQAQAQNEYGMQIQKLLQEGQSQQQNSILDQFKSIMSGNQQQTDNLYRQAGLDLDQQKFAYQQTQDSLKTQNAGPKNAYDALSERALSQYGGDPVKSRAAVDEILAAYRNNPNPQNVGDFLNGLDQDALKANPEMMSLVYDFISRVMADQKK